MLLHQLTLGVDSEDPIQGHSHLLVGIHILCLEEVRLHVREVRSSPYKQAHTIIHQML